MFIAFLLSLAPASQFSYEINRAKHALGEYGQHLFREEKVHVREATNGSQIETFCAVVQYRDGETEQIKENGFYWILRVVPAIGYLSDYERGQWEGAGAVDNNEFTKLCKSLDKIDDGLLLRSVNHKSSGSTYDPSIESQVSVSSDWLIGSWIYGTSCATSRDEYFRSDGYYDGVIGRGKWALNGNILMLSIDVAYVTDSTEEEGFSEKYLQKSEMHNYLVQRTGIDAASLGAGEKIMRC